jgi:hypothetical protein
VVSIGAALAWAGLVAAMVGRQLTARVADFREFYEVNHDLIWGDLARRHVVPYTYPTFFHVVVAPYAALPLWLASLAWALTLSVALALGLRALHRMLASRGAPLPAWLSWGVPLALSLPVMITDFTLGNVNLLILALVCLAAAALHERRELAAGGSLAVAISLKILPVIFVPFLLIQRRVRVAALSVGLSLVFVFALPSVVLGPTRGLELNREWLRTFRSVVSSTETRHWVDDPGTFKLQNQSLKAVLVRTFSPAPKDGPGEPASVVTLDPEQIGFLHRLISALLVALTAVLLARRPVGRDDARAPLVLGLEVSLVLVLMFLISPVSWANYMVYFVVPLLALCRLFAVPAVGRRVLAATLAVIGLVMLAGSFEIGKRYGLLFASAVLLYAAAARALVLVKRTAPGLSLESRSEDGTTSPTPVIAPAREPEPLAR